MGNIKRRGRALYSITNKLLELLGASGKDAIEFSSDDTRTAIAVLYYHVIVVDGRIRLAELEHFRRVLGDTLDVSEDELLLFEDSVLKHMKTEGSLASFSTTVKKLPVEKRMEILRHMHQISIADKELHEFEINLVARTAEVLGIEGSWENIIEELEDNTDPQTRDN
jgi:uncharacterized tellurite resistance protein B-like protein